jgi:hypothetical protein
LLPGDVCGNHTILPAPPQRLGCCLSVLSNARIPAKLKNQSPKARAKKIKLLFFDVDGVLTDGKL